MKKSIISMIFLAVLCLVFAAPVQATTWDLNADFAAQQAIDNTANSFGAWSLGFSEGSDHLEGAWGFAPVVYNGTYPIPNPIQLLEDPYPNRVYPIGTVPQGWVAQNGPGFIMFNDSGADWVWTDKGGSSVVAAGMTGMRTSDPVHAAKVRWTSPAGGMVHIEGLFDSGSAFLKLYGIRQNDTIELIGSPVTAEDVPFSFDVVVAMGDTIDFMVRQTDPAGMNNNMVGLDVLITPEPITMSLLGLGGLAILRRRR